MGNSPVNSERSPREGLQINTCAVSSPQSQGVRSPPFRRSREISADGEKQLSHETHTTASPTSTSPTRHHSRCTTLTPREQLPPTLKMSMYTADFLAAYGGDSFGFEKGIGAIWEMKDAPGSRHRNALGEVFIGADRPEPTEPN